MPEFELAQNFKNAQASEDGSSLEQITIMNDDGTEEVAYLEGAKRSRLFPRQMSKWYNTTSGFVCGIFGGFLMVTISGVFVTIIGFLLFIGGAFGVMYFNQARCTGEYRTEKGVEEVPQKIVQECRVKVGLGRSDGSDKGYWR